MWMMAGVATAYCPLGYGGRPAPDLLPATDFRRSAQKEGEA